MSGGEAPISRIVHRDSDEWSRFGGNQEATVSEEIEYEEINSDDVDRVVAALEELSGSITSETIRAFLEECSHNIYYLVYDDEEGPENLAA